MEFLEEFPWDFSLEKGSRDAAWSNESEVSRERGQRAAGEITTSLQKVGGDALAGGSIAIGRDNVLVRVGGEFVVGGWAGAD